MKIKNIMIHLTVLCCFSVHGVMVSDECIADPVEQIFTRIYKEHEWISRESVSGPGSELRFTKNMINKLNNLIRDLGIKSIADAPCGDMNWMQYVDMRGCRYVGFDIVKELIERNIAKFGTTKEFRHANLIEDAIGKFDLIICRDMLAHLTYEQIFKALRNFKQSGSKYILVTTRVTTKVNLDMDHTGECRFGFLNLQLPPFNFPAPLALIEEETPFAFERGKHLALWLLEDLII